jgi:mono/diheme cytochrome c family protein
MSKIEPSGRIISARYGLLLAMVLAVFSACYYDSEEKLYPDSSPVCDTTNVTFGETILPILQSNCFSCHGAAEYVTAGGGLNLEDMSTLNFYAQEGILLGAIQYDPGFSPMPKGRAKLDSCSILKVKTWIDSN